MRRTSVVKIQIVAATVVIALVVFLAIPRPKEWKTVATFTSDEYGVPSGQAGVRLPSFRVQGDEMVVSWTYVPTFATLPSEFAYIMFNDEGIFNRTHEYSTGTTESLSGSKTFDDPPSGEYYFTVFPLNLDYWRIEVKVYG